HRRPLGKGMMMSWLSRGCAIRSALNRFSRSYRSGQLPIRPVFILEELEDRVVPSSTLQLVSTLQGPVGPPGITAGKGSSDRGNVSADGRYVVYESSPTDLVPGQVTDPGASTSPFLLDRSTGKTTLVSHAAGAPTTTGNSFSYDPIISSDGSTVVFY